MPVAKLTLICTALLVAGAGSAQTPPPTFPLPAPKVIDPNAPPPAKAVIVEKNDSGHIWVQAGEILVDDSDRFWATYLPATREKNEAGTASGKFRFTYYQPGPEHPTGETVLWADSLVETDCTSGATMVVKIDTFSIDASHLGTQEPPGGVPLPPGSAYSDLLCDEGSTPAR